jgi:hypothetical protein
MSGGRGHARRATLVGAMVALALGGTATLLALTRTATGSSPGGELAQMSNEGQTVEPGGGQREELQNVGAVAVSRLATRAGRTFYRLLQPDGTICYAIDTTGGDHVGNTSCPRAGTTFPTPSNPVLDLSIFESTSHTPGEEHVVSAQGFAADGVKTIALLDRAARILARERVSGNVYALDVPGGKVAASVVAYDSKHAEVYRVP